MSIESDFEEKIDPIQEWKMYRRHLIFKGIGTGVTIGLPVIVFISLYVGFEFFDFHATNVTTWWWFGLAISFLSANLFSQYLFDRRTKINLRDVKRSTENLREEIRESIAENLRPSITVLIGKDEVRRAAAKLFSEVLECSDINDKFIHHFGAANLSPTSEEIRDSQSNDDTEESSIERLGNVIEQINDSSNGIQIFRHLRIWKPEQFKTRSPKLQEDFLKWLENQIKLMQAGPNYQIVDSRRAPVWGDSRNSIVTAFGYLDVVGDGENGFHISGQEISQRMRELLRRHAEGARAKSTKPTRYGHETVELLEILHSKLNKSMDDSKDGANSVPEDSD